MLREKCPNTRVFSGPYIPTEETPYSGTFHAVAKKLNLSYAEHHKKRSLINVL